MNFKVDSIPFFDKQFKRLLKKYPSLSSDILSLVEILESSPFQGVSLDNNCYKIRLAIKSKNKGKSGGARVISYVYIANSKVYLMSIYDKSEQPDIAENDLINLVNSLK